MPGMFSIEVLGLDKLQKKLDPKSTLQKPQDEQIRTTAVKLEGEVRKATPVDTGRLRSSIFSDFSGGGAVVGTNVRYAPFVEFGTEFMEARHVEGGSARVLGTGPFTFAMKRLDLKGVEIQLGKKVEKIWGK
tara:strand:+ start:6142 stop:6537 length:396 start_codon:yes stop_codon:yes gene_type:complete